MNRPLVPYMEGHARPATVRDWCLYVNNASDSRARGQQHLIVIDN